MKRFLKNLFLSLSPPEEPPLSEAEHLLAEIEETRKKIDYAWNRLDYADPEYVDIAVLEILLAETQYGLLYKRYRLLIGMVDDSPYFISSATKVLSTTLQRNQNHAFYKSLINPTSESPSSVSATSPSISPN